MRKILILIALLAASGCATSPQDGAAAKAAQARDDGYRQGYTDAQRQAQARSQQNPSLLPPQRMSPPPSLSAPAIGLPH
jgi:hypothetical protein